MSSCKTFWTALVNSINEWWNRSLIVGVFVLMDSSAGFQCSFGNVNEREKGKQRILISALQFLMALILKLLINLLTHRFFIGQLSSRLHWRYGEIFSDGFVVHSCLMCQWKNVGNWLKSGENADSICEFVHHDVIAVVRCTSWWRLTLVEREDLPPVWHDDCSL